VICDITYIFVLVWNGKVLSKAEKAYRKTIIWVHSRKNVSLGNRWQAKNLNIRHVRNIMCYSSHKWTNHILSHHAHCKCHSAMYPATWTKQDFMENVFCIIVAMYLIVYKEFLWVEWNEQMPKHWPYILANTISI
jgi:hypothetical protein